VSKVVSEAAVSMVNSKGYRCYETV